MRLAQPTLAAGILACVLAFGTLVPPALATDRHIIDEGHADAFFIDTSGEVPLVQVNHGLQNKKFDPNAISFGIDDATYGTYEPFAPYLDRGYSGYYTASEEADDYFEPGWSAPAFRKNGYSAVRIDFTDVQGPGDVAILGNRLDESAPFAKFLLPTSRAGEILGLADSLNNEQSAAAFATTGIPDGSYYLGAGMTLPVFGHTHAHWFFTASGRYFLTGKAVAMKADGTCVESAPFTTVFEVEKNPLEASSGQPAPNSRPQPGPGNEPAPDTPTPADPGEGGSSPSGYTVRTDPVVFSSGHMDAFYVGTRDGRPQLFLKEDVTDSEPTAREPSSVKMVFVKERYEQTGDFRGSIDEKAGYHSNAIGRDMSVYSPGWSVDDYRANGFSKVEVRFESVDGPGRIVLTRTPSLDGTLAPVLTNASRYLVSGSSLPITGHAHGYWLFTRAGTYTLTAKAVVTADDGRVSESLVQTYTFIVEPNPADPAVGSGSVPVPGDGIEDPSNPSDPIGPVPEPNPSPEGPSAGSADIATTHEKVELDHGHLDLLTAIVKDGVLHLLAKDDSTGGAILRDPSDITLRIRDNALATIGKGLAPGLPEKGYFLDAGGQAQQEILFPGWDTSAVRPNFGAVDLEVVDMSVPKGGAAYMFNTKRFGGVEAAFTNGKLAIDAGSVIRQERPAHVHTNWLFTAPGVYTMKVRAKAWPVNRSADAQPLVSKVVTYTWLVGSSTEIEEPNPQPEPEGPRPGPAEPSAPVPPAAPAPNVPENRVTDASATNSAQAGTQVQKDTPAKGAETPKGSALASTGTAGVAGAVAASILFTLGGVGALSMRRRQLG